MRTDSKRETFKCPRCRTSINTTSIEECSKGSCTQFDNMISSGTEINSDNDICYCCQNLVVPEKTSSFTSVMMEGFVGGRPQFREYHNCNNCGVEFHFNNQDKEYRTFL